jgi:hypothetical protein
MIGSRAARQAIITTAISIGPTSMPLNEFTLYRARRRPAERHALVVLGPIDASTLAVYRPRLEESGVLWFDCGGSIQQLLVSVCPHSNANQYAPRPRITAAGVRAKM